MKHSRDVIGDPLLRLNLFGALRATTPKGENVLPRSRKAQAILCYLALTADAMVPRRRLVELLWSKRWPEQGQASLRQSLIDIRSALQPVGGLITIGRQDVTLDRNHIWLDWLSSRADRDAHPSIRETRPSARLLETLEGLDPAFDAWIDQIRTETNFADAGAETMAGSEVPAQAVRSRRLLLAVAPVIQLGPINVDEFVVPAIAQELVTALARFRWLGVRYSPMIGEADYRVEGYLTQSPAGVRIVTRLIDQRDRDQVAWTGESHSSLPLSPTAIIELVEAIIAQLDPEILAIETRKALAGINGSRDAYSRVLRAMALLYRFEESGWREAMMLLEEARNIDPHYARALAVSAMCRIIGIAQAWSSDAAAEIATAGREADNAIGLDPRDSLGLALSGHISAFVHHDFERALGLFERAISANPSCGLAWGYSALTHAYTCRIDEAWDRLRQAREIMVHDPFLSHLEGFRPVICFFDKDWATTVEACRHELSQRPRFDNIRKLLIGALCQLGRFDEARAEDARLRTFAPAFCWQRHLRSYPFHFDADRESLRSALTRAGLLPAISAVRSTRSVRRSAVSQANSVS